MNASKKDTGFSLHDPVVRACILQSVQEGCTYTETLERLVTMLAEEKQELQGRLIALAQRGVV